VINSRDLLEYGSHLHWVLDVFEHEPDIDPLLLDRAILTTPHIAGYAIQSKWRGTQMIYQAIAEHFKLERKDTIDYPIAPPTLQLNQANWEDAVLAIYNPMEDAQRFRAAIQQSTLPNAFLKSRADYPTRHEFSSPMIGEISLPDADNSLLQNLEVKTS